jgi:MoaA/NifB/PqqE/SkfB family radical SAM enzyme
MSAARHALLVLPPDPWALADQRAGRLPPQGAALVAAVCAGAGLTVRAVDLSLSVERAPLDDPTDLLHDDERLWAAARGESDPVSDALVEALLVRMGDLRADLLLVSLERHTQLPLAALLACAFKRRTGRPVAVGGSGAGSFAARLAAAGVVGVDVASAASTPGEILAVLDALSGLAPGRREPAFEPLGGPRELSSDGWPLPDFGIYDLAAYREGLSSDGGAPAPLVLPYTPSFGCAFRCAFCQDPQPQAAQPARKVAADLAALGERWGARDFLFLSCQANGSGAALARVLREEGQDVHWSDSWRVTPSPPGVFDELAAGGCVGLTFGVESASRRVLQRMRKGHRPADATRVVREAATAGLFTRVNLLPCFPGETAAESAETVDWVRANAAFVDDLAPSSFYLEPDSPLGREPGRFGLVVRGARELSGDDRFRKPAGVLAYDEVGGLSWEERQATLAPAEEALRAAWTAARGERSRTGGLDPVSMLVLRRRFATREAALAAPVAPGAGARQETRGGAAPELASLRRRVADALPPELRDGAQVQLEERALVVRFHDASGAPHVLEARLRDESPEAVVRGPWLGWSYREPGGPGSAERFVGSYRRLFARWASLDADLAAVLRSSGPAPSAAPPASPVPSPGEERATPHVGEAELLAVALSAPPGRARSATVASFVSGLAARGQPLCLFLSLANDCDQACEFCDRPARRAAAGSSAEVPAGGPDLVDSGAFDALLEALAGRGPGAELCLTGHDWALHARIDALLARLARSPAPRLSLYGPSTRLADEAFAARVLAVPGLAEVRLSLHAAEPGTHDLVSGTPGSGARVLAALGRLRARGVAVRVNAVLTRRTVAGLPGLLALLAREGVAGSLLAFRPDAGPVPFDGRDLLAPWSAIRDALEPFAKPEAGLALELIGLPACAVPPALRARQSHAWNSAEAEDLVFPAVCDGCGLRTMCGGVSKLYAQTFGGEGLRPVRG